LWLSLYTECFQDKGTNRPGTNSPQTVYSMSFFYFLQFRLNIKWYTISKCANVCI